MSSKGFRKDAALKYNEYKAETAKAMLRQKSAEAHEAKAGWSEEMAAKSSRRREKLHRMRAEGKRKQATTFLTAAKNIEDGDKIRRIIEEGHKPNTAQSKKRRELKKTNGTIAEKEEYRSKQGKACATPCKQNRATCNPNTWCYKKYYCDLAKSDGSSSGERYQCEKPSKRKKNGGTKRRKRPSGSRKRTRKRTRKRARSKTRRRRRGGSKQRRRVKTRRRMKRGGG
jgi:hypothetical protein